MLFVQLVDEDAFEGIIEILAAIAVMGRERRCLPLRRPAGPILIQKIVEPGRGADTLAVDCRIAADLRVGDDATCDHLCLMAGQDRGGADGDCPQPPRHARLYDVDIAAARIVSDAEAVLDPKPSGGPRLALGHEQEVYVCADAGERLLDDLLEPGGGHGRSPIACASDPEMRSAASPITSSDR